MKDLLNRSVSTATLRTEDLLKSFAMVLDTLVQTTFDGAEDDKARYEELVNDAHEVDPTTEQAEEILTELIDTLNEFAPEGYYFGTHPGDGADFGFWSVDDE